MSEQVKVLRTDMFRHSTVTTDAAGNTYVRNEVAGPEPDWLDRVNWRGLDRLATLFTGGFLLYVALQLLWWVGVAIWPVPR